MFACQAGATTTKRHEAEDRDHKERRENAPGPAFVEADKRKAAVVDLSDNQ